MINVTDNTNLDEKLTTTHKHGSVASYKTRVESNCQKHQNNLQHHLINTRCGREVLS